MPRHRYGWALADTASFAKILADPDTRLLLGAHIIGPQASILIQPLIQAMCLGKHRRRTGPWRSLHPPSAHRNHPARAARTLRFTRAPNADASHQITTSALARNQDRSADQEPMRSITSARRREKPEETTPSRWRAPLSQAAPGRIANGTIGTPALPEGRVSGRCWSASAKCSRGGDKVGGSFARSQPDPFRAC
jgi:hypothetical protein